MSWFSFFANHRNTVLYNQSSVLLSYRSTDRVLLFWSPSPICSWESQWRLITVFTLIVRGSGPIVRTLVVHTVGNGERRTNICFMCCFLKIHMLHYRFSIMKSKLWTLSISYLFVKHLNVCVWSYENCKKILNRKLGKHENENYV